MKFESLGDYCKWLEKNFSNEIMIPKLPVIIRLDGNNFHNWTKGLKRPFDENLNTLMTETTKFLVEETNAIIGYTQSDEITLILYGDNFYNDGKKQKILSKLTSKACQFFNEKRKDLLPEHNKLAIFDCRIYQVPTLQDACSQLLWRENDCTKNAISSLAQSLFSHKSLQGLNGSQMQDKMMLEKNVNFNDLPIKYKRGVYVKRKKVFKNFDKEELENLPKYHNARKNPEMLIERSVIEVVEFPIFNKIKNKVEVIFEDKEPILKSDLQEFVEGSESRINKI